MQSIHTRTSDGTIAGALRDYLLASEGTAQRSQAWRDICWLVPDEQERGRLVRDAERASRGSDGWNVVIDRERLDCWLEAQP